MAEEGVGLQEIHMDACGGRLGEQRITLLLYLSDGSRTTAVCRMNRKTRMNLLSADPDTAPEEQLRRGVTEVFAYSNYESFPASFGDLFVFRQNLPHFGTACPPGVSERRLLFCEYTIREDIQLREKGNQKFRFNFFWSAFYSDIPPHSTLPYAQALVDSIASGRTQPLRHLYDKDKAEAIRSLKRHELLVEYLKYVPDSVTRQEIKTQARKYTTIPGPVPPDSPTPCSTTNHSTKRKREAN